MTPGSRCGPLLAPRLPRPASAERLCERYSAQQNAITHSHRTTMKRIRIVVTAASYHRAWAPKPPASGASRQSLPTGIRACAPSGAVRGNARGPGLRPRGRSSTAARARIAGPPMHRAGAIGLSLCGPSQHGGDRVESKHTCQRHERGGHQHVHQHRQGHEQAPVADGSVCEAYPRT